MKEPECARTRSHYRQDHGHGWRKSTRQQQAGRDPSWASSNPPEEALGTKTIIKHGKKAADEINYYSADDLERILDIICQD